jgi:hypothetical protein
MSAVLADILALVGLLALGVFLVLSTAGIDVNRKTRIKWQKFTARLGSWK